MPDTLEVPTLGAVGIVGVGRMGGAMWGRLRDRGLDPLVFDAVPAVRDAIAARGAAVAASAPDLAARCTTVVLSLPRSDDVEDAVFGPHGLALALAAGSVVIDTTSGRPAVSRRIAAALTGNGVGYLDAGVSGGVGGAAAGTLKMMIGGDARLVARCEPLLEMLATNRWHCGPVGAGHAMKTVLNLSAQTKMMAEIESLLIARAAGLDTRQTSEVLGLNLWLHYLLGPDGRVPFGFTLGLAGKDHDVAMELASELHVAAPISGTAQQVMRAVVGELGPDADLVDFVSVFERWSGTSLDAGPGSRSGAE